MSNDHYPPVSFYFKVSIPGGSEVSFQEVSGISMEMGTEEIEEGGDNRYIHKVPTTARYANLVLKRGVINKDSDIAQWCEATFNGGLDQVIKPKSLTVALLNEKGNPLASWHFDNAYPVKWEVSDLISMENEIAIESLEFSYTYFKRTK